MSILLISTTGIVKLSESLRMLKVPKIFVLQLLLTYRYISVLLEEVSTMLTAYSLRAPNQKGVSRKALGSFVGQLMLRTMDRAERVYQSMNLRGFEGEYNSGSETKMKSSDITYIAVWSMLFVIARLYDVPALIGLILTGVI